LVQQQEQEHQGGMVTMGVNSRTPRHNAITDVHKGSAWFVMDDVFESPATRKERQQRSDE
jgi:hypothetical protein